MTMTFDKPSYVDQHVGGMIRLFRKSRGFSRSQMAKRIGLDERQLLKFERGMERIPPKMLGGLCAELNIRPKLLFDTLNIDMGSKTASDPSEGRREMR